jgi:hypothetical protein
MQKHQAMKPDINELKNNDIVYIHHNKSYLDKSQEHSQI